jgi:hypothetical protein
MTITDNGNSVTFASTATDTNETYQKGSLMYRRIGEDFEVYSATSKHVKQQKFATTDITTPVVADGDALETFLQGALFV